MKHAHWLMLAGLAFFGVRSINAAEPAKVINDVNWTITIRSAQQTSAVAPLQAEVAPVPESLATPVLFSPDAPQTASPQPEPPANAPAPAPVINPYRMSYVDAYDAVPFSRAQYEANPGYRHQAALELMFGTLRPMTMVQQYTPRASRYPDSWQYPYGRMDTQHINIRNFGSGWNSQSPWGYPYGLRGNW